VSDNAAEEVMNRSGVPFSSCYWAWQLYRTEGLHLSGCAVKTAILGNTKKGYPVRRCSHTPYACIYM